MYTKMCVVAWSFLLTISATAPVSAHARDSILVEGPSGQTFDPQHARYAPIVSSNVSIRVSNVRPLAISYAAPGQRERELEIPAVVGQIADAFVVGGRLIVVGWCDPSLVSDVSVFDIESGKQTDEFWAYHVAVSFSGERIAFVRFYPSHFISGWEDQIRIYDVRLGKDANRPIYAEEDSENNGSNPLLDVGFAIYPLEKTELNRSNLEIAADEWHRLESSLYWGPRSEQLFFIAVKDGVRRIVWSNVPTIDLMPKAARTFDSNYVDTRTAVLSEFPDECTDKMIRQRSKCINHDSLPILEPTNAGVRVTYTSIDARVPSRTVMVAWDRFQPVPR